MISYKLRILVCILLLASGYSNIFSQTDEPITPITPGGDDVTTAFAIPAEKPDIRQDYLKIQMPKRYSFTFEAPEYVESGDEWWKQFKDTLLFSLITRADSLNFDIRSAFKRIELAKQQVKLTKTNYTPTLKASAGWLKSQDSGTQENPVTLPDVDSYFSAGLTMNWEIDIFGRVAANLKADKLALAITAADYDAVKIALSANVASTYISLRTYQQQYLVALKHIESQEKILKITQARFEAGLGNMLEVTQAKMVLYATQATIPQIQASIRNAAHALTTLTVSKPTELVPVLLEVSPLPEFATMPEIGVPTDLLRRRPDILQAELAIDKCAAQIGIAKKEWLPSLSLSGYIGTSAHKFKNLFGENSLDYSIEPALSWTVFQGLSRAVKVTEARIQMEEAIDNYNNTIINAVEEVETAIYNYYATVNESNLLNSLIEQSEKALNLSLDLYKQGLSSFTDVMNAQESYLGYQNQLLTCKGKYLNYLVSLYKALGGGW